MKSREIVTYNQLAPIEAGVSDEPLVDARAYDADIVTEYEKFDMQEYTDNRILVRDSVAQKLAAANQSLKKQGLNLKVVYGYRHPEIQQRYFETTKERLRGTRASIEDEELNALAHNFVAVPEVAGHPTGGAVDLTLITLSGDPVDMGTRIADYADEAKIRTDAPGLTTKQQQNRRILHDAMTDAGFTPFYGEWWHFSYGDKEWAFLNGLPKALYGPITM